MTTAHRATWKAARGGLQEEGSFRLHVPSAGVSSKDAPTETNLKARNQTNIPRDELQDRLAGLDQPPQKRRKRSRFGPAPKLQRESPSLFESAIPQQSRGGDEIRESILGTKIGGSLPLREDRRCLDSKDVGVASEAESEGESEGESDDNEAELVAELEKIRREKAYEHAKKRANEQKQHINQELMGFADGSSVISPAYHRTGEISDTASLATGSVPAFSVQRRWNDDVIFRNDVTPERGHRPRFINDTVRNDYHRRFMKRHIK